MSFINLISMVGTPVAVITFLFSAYQYWQNKRHEKCKETLDAYNMLQKEVFDVLYLKYTRARIKEIAENWRKAEYKEEYHRLGVLLARIEHFCVGVEQGIYDWKIVYELGHGFFDGTMKAWLSPLVERKESFTKEELYGNLNKVWIKMAQETDLREKLRETEGENK